MQFLFSHGVKHFKSRKLHLISNRMIWVRSLRCDYICENKDDVWVHKRVSFKVLILNIRFLFYKFPFSQQLNFCQVHIPAEKLVECGDCVWVGDRLDNIRFSFNSFFVNEINGQLLLAPTGALIVMMVYYICWTARSIAQIEVLFPTLPEKFWWVFFWFTGP